MMELSPGCGPTLEGMLLSLLLGVIGVTGQFVAVRRPRAGWAICLAGQPLWVVFAVVHGQYGLLLLTAGYTAAQLRLLGKARAVRGHDRRRAILAAVGQ